MRVLSFRISCAALVVLAVGAAHAASGKSPELPQTVPVPEVHTAPAGNVLPKHIGDTPVPELKPGETVPVSQKPPETPPEAKPNPQENEKNGVVVTPETVPIPEESPLEDHVDEPGKPVEPADAQKPIKPTLPDARSNQPRPATMPADEVACRQRLGELGVTFEERSAESDASGCAMPYPLSVSTLGKTVKLEPAGLMNCAMAEAASRFTADTIMPAAKRDIGADLQSIAQASAYVCRPRAGTRKLSEHAFGNALDIARFNLSGGKAVDVILRPEENEARFLGSIRKAACGPFKTVLGPGSNADHATHLHLDLAPRKHGGTVCE